MRALSEARTVFEKGRVRVAPSEGYGLFDRHVMSGFSTPCRDLVAEDMTPYLMRRVQRFFAERIAAQGCDMLVQHLTGWPRVGFLRAAYPDLKVVHVVRDGRAVANSWLQMGWWDGWLGPDKWIYGPLPADLRPMWEESGRSFPVLAALGWRMLVDAYAAARDAARRRASGWTSGTRTSSPTRGTPSGGSSTSPAWAGARSSRRASPGTRSSSIAVPRGVTS